MVMNREDMMARMSSAPEEKKEEPALGFETTAKLMNNLETMPEEEKNMLSELLQEPIVELLDSLFGEPIMAQVAEQVGAKPEETPATEEGIMGRPEQMSIEDEETPATEMAMGGSITSKMKEMRREGMSPSAVRSRIK